ncbi:MAG: peptidylprolyl isomerase [Pseudomonadota bacterium]
MAAALALVAAGPALAQFRSLPADSGAAPATAGNATGQSAEPVPQGSAQTPFRAIAVVNDQVITGFDLQQRVQLLRLLGFPAASEEALRSAALNELIEDKLKMQAGRRDGMSAGQEDIERGIGEIAQQIDVSPAELETLLANQGIETAALRDFVEANMVWRTVVQRRFASRVEPGEAEIDGEIALLSGSASTDYRIQEIGLPETDGGRTAAETRALAERLQRDLQDGAAFSAAARELSRAPSAAQGGNVGGVRGAQLPAALREALAATPAGQIAPPQQVPGGISLIRVVEKRSAAQGGIDPNDPELRERVRRRIVEDQANRLADGLLQELRRDALIEGR